MSDGTEFDAGPYGYSLFNFSVSYFNYIFQSSPSSFYLFFGG